MAGTLKEIRFDGCSVTANPDGYGGFVVHVWEGAELMLTFGVPSKDKLSQPKYWNSIAYGSALTKILFGPIAFPRTGSKAAIVRSVPLAELKPVRSLGVKPVRKIGGPPWRS